MNLRMANLFERFVVLTNDEVVPITNMFDSCQEETDVPEEAEQIVVGPTAAGKWLVFSVVGGDREPTN